MCKKSLGMLLMGAMAFFCSCVDDTYDLARKWTRYEETSSKRRHAIKKYSYKDVQPQQ